MNRWSNNHKDSSQRITSSCVLNDSSETPLLAVASDDGSVRVWSNPFTHTRTHINNYANKDPYFKTQWLEAKSNTSCSKTSHASRDISDCPSLETAKNDWKKRGSSLMVGNSFVGDNIGGFLGDGCRLEKPKSALAGGFFAKGYAWQTNNASVAGSSSNTSTPSPSSGTSGRFTLALSKDPMKSELFYIIILPALSYLNL